MNCPSLSGKVRMAAGLAVSAGGLIAALSTPAVLHAQTPAEDRAIAEKLKGDDYKRGETPTGHDYGIIKKGDPQKSDAVKKNSDDPHEKHDMKHGTKPETHPGTGSTVDRDKRESHEGSGPDPFGRY